jgi:hypothetical protein
VRVQGFIDGVGLTYRATVEILEVRIRSTRRSNPVPKTGQAARFVPFLHFSLPLFG